MNEKVFERNLRKKVKKLGGLAIKFSSPFYTGMPDRIVFMPGGRIWFVEIKSPGKQLSPRQTIVSGELGKLGHQVQVINSQVSLDQFLNSIAQ
jgi:hypothetical protein